MFMIPEEGTCTAVIRKHSQFLQYKKKNGWLEQQGFTCEKTEQGTDQWEIKMAKQKDVGLTFSPKDTTGIPESDYITIS